MPSPDPNHRAATLIARRELKMARSAHAYVRGSTERFYDWIASDGGHHVPTGPAVWICGDCHVGNLGPIGHPEGRAVVELRDLDQTVIGNPAHDVVRLALSLAMSARSSDLPGVITTRITEDLVAGYERAFDGEKPSEQIDDLPDPIRLVMRQAVRRTWDGLFDERLGDGESRVIPIGKRFWELSKEERVALEGLVEQEDVRSLVAKLESREDHTRISFVDAAFWVKGCSSLGLWRAAVLVEVRYRNKKGRKRRKLSLLDVKQAVDASAPWAAGVKHDMPPGERVLAGARKLAPALGLRMVAASVLDRSVFIRELLPQDLKVELDHISVEDGRSVAYYLGMVVGRAHGRQLADGERQSWHREMHTHRSKNIEAPLWLWSALVDLVGVHERAYLEHCRGHALAELKRNEAHFPTPAPPPPPIEIPVTDPGDPNTALVASAAGAADA
ncbi:MAG: DUF2252 family protein [Deltaproteobacteria bacterium]